MVARLIRSDAGSDAAPACALACCSADTDRPTTRSADRRRRLQAVTCGSSNIAVASDAIGNAAYSVTVERAEEIAAAAAVADEADEAVNELNWFAVAVGGEDAVDEDDSDAIGEWLGGRGDRSSSNSACPVRMEGSYGWCSCSTADCERSTGGSRSPAIRRSASLSKEHCSHCLRSSYSNCSSAKASRSRCLR